MCYLENKSAPYARLQSLTENHVLSNKRECNCCLLKRPQAIEN